MTTTSKNTDVAELVRTWSLPWEVTLGSSVRAVGVFLEVRAGLPASARKALTIKSRELTLRTATAGADDFYALSAQIAKSLEGIESLPIIPREIEDILGITSTERRRWLADGRLPSAGTRTVNLRGRARKITFHVFDPRLVEDVLDRGLVDTWREEDALAAAERRRSAVWTRKRLREPHGVTIRKSDTNGRAPNLIGWTDFEGEGLLRETKAR
jgi:hypothetical protein